jgi:DNA polymerase-3 subunit beta
MKFTINAQTLQTELAFLSGVSEQKNTIPVLQNLSIVSDGNSTLIISATDLDVTLSCKAEAIVSKPGSILVPMGKLLAITKSIPKTADITFQALENERVKLTCERANFTLIAPAFDSFPEIKNSPEAAIEIPANIFSSMINSTLYGITQEESRYTLSGAKVEIDDQSMKMITTDGHRLAKSENTTVTSKDKIDVLIPRKALAQLAKISAVHDGSVSFASDTNHIYFQVGTRSLSSRLLTGQFPNYEMVIPKNNPNSFAMNISQFRETLKRVALMADERSHSIRMDIKPNQLTLSASTPDDGEAIEHIPIEYDGEETAIGFNSEYLLDSYGSLNGSQQATMSFKDGNSQVLIEPTTPTTNSVIAIVMPLRLG